METETLLAMSDEQKQSLGRAICCTNAHLKAELNGLLATIGMNRKLFPKYDSTDMALEHLRDAILIVLPQL